jgi:3'-5' exoribonuclease
MFDKILADNEIVEKLKICPGGKLWHHAYCGGVIEHSVSVSNISEAAAKSHPLVRLPLLIAGALIHDIGKIWEFTTDKYYIDYSVEGRLLGHIQIGTHYISGILSSIDGFPDELKNELTHLILSHHGSPELGSPVKPLTIEASILHHADLWILRQQHSEELSQEILVRTKNSATG